MRIARHVRDAGFALSLYAELGHGRSAEDDRTGCANPSHRVVFSARRGIDEAGARAPRQSAYARLLLDDHGDPVGDPAPSLAVAGRRKLRLAKRSLVAKVENGTHARLSCREHPRSGESARQRFGRRGFAAAVRKAKSLACHGPRRAGEKGASRRADLGGRACIGRLSSSAPHAVSGATAARSIQVGMKKAVDQACPERVAGDAGQSFAETFPSREGAPPHPHPSPGAVRRRREWC